MPKCILIANFQGNPQDVSEMAMNPKNEGCIFLFELPPRPLQMPCTVYLKRMNKGPGKKMKVIITEEHLSFCPGHTSTLKLIIGIKWCCKWNFPQQDKVKQHQLGLIHTTTWKNWFQVFRCFTQDRPSWARVAHSKHYLFSATVTVAEFNPERRWLWTSPWATLFLLHACPVVANPLQPHGL